MNVLLDYGHGVETLGKRSPDGILREYAYVREIGRRVRDILVSKKYNVIEVVTSDTDVKLSERVKFVNKVCRDKGTSNCMLVSIHVNAAGNGSWNKARGWSVFISQNASAKSKILANCMYDAAELEKFKIRKPMPTQKYWVQSLAMCRDTNCPACLVENFFMDNKEDVAFLLSEEGKEQIVNAIVNGIVKYIKKIEG